ncbi:MAG: tRNA-dihydrouridine synthase family protein, partial [bacterium]
MWQKLNKPIYALAPMAGVTDSPFRHMCKSFGADVVYSEMASAAALAYNPKKTLLMLDYNRKESPYVIQLFGSDPKHFIKAVQILANKAQGFDINFGCPVPKVIKQTAGCELFKNLKLSKEVIKQT